MIQNLVPLQLSACSLHAGKPEMTVVPPRLIEPDSDDETSKPKTKVAPGKAPSTLVDDESDDDGDDSVTGDEPAIGLDNDMDIPIELPDNQDDDLKDQTGSMKKLICMILFYIYLFSF